eukprot:3257203-Rhodomonas_salina.1
MVSGFLQRCKFNAARFEGFLSGLGAGGRGAAGTRSRGEHAGWKAAHSIARGELLLLRLRVLCGRRSWRGVWCDETVLTWCIVVSTRLLAWCLVGRDCGSDVWHMVTRGCGESEHESGPELAVPGSGPQPARQRAQDAAASGGRGWEPEGRGGAAGGGRCARPAR